jgi:hypothetical protein
MKLKFEAQPNQRGGIQCLPKHCFLRLPCCLLYIPWNRTTCIQQGSDSVQGRQIINSSAGEIRRIQMQAVAPFVAMILVLAVIFYLAHWDANRGKIKR